MTFAFESLEELKSWYRHVHHFGSPISEEEIGEIVDGGVPPEIADEAREFLESLKKTVDDYLKHQREALERGESIEIE